jgi:hypothetical protein
MEVGDSFLLHSLRHLGLMFLAGEPSFRGCLLNLPGPRLSAI